MMWPKFRIAKPYKYTLKVPLMTNSLPGLSTIGILGGGQLARMLCMAASRLGFQTVVFDPDSDCPAKSVASQTITAGYGNQEALTRFAAEADVVTCEFESIPPECLDFVGSIKPLYPKPSAFATLRNRALEKQLAHDNGIETARWKVLSLAMDFGQALQAPWPDTQNSHTGSEVILKTAEEGYDGKGQWRLILPLKPDKIPSELRPFMALEVGIQEASSFPKTGFILEEKVVLDMEFSILLVRDVTGKILYYPPTENRHENGILRESIAPAAIPPALAAQAKDWSGKLAAALDYVGILAVEWFITKDGRLLFNEAAPRPHNSGHWTIEGASLSQFEAHIRAISGWQLPNKIDCRPCQMQNLLGDEIHAAIATKPQANTFVHDYGKKDVRLGRKMGHITEIIVK